MGEIDREAKVARKRREEAHREEKLKDRREREEEDQTRRKRKRTKGKENTRERWRTSTRRRVVKVMRRLPLNKCDRARSSPLNSI